LIKNVNNNIINIKFEYKIIKNKTISNKNLKNKTAVEKVFITFITAVY